METKEMKLGSLYTFGAFLIWGLVTLYWKQLDGVSSMEILAHRFIWSFVFIVVLLIVLKDVRSFLKECIRLLKDPKSIIGITLATIFITINWFLFIWAVTNDYVLQASLGYYINPLVSIFLGIIVLKERVTTRQTIAFLLCIVGVLYLTFSGGIFPWVSLALAFSFGTYGLLKKKIDVSPTHGIAIETMLVTPFMLIYLMLLPAQAFSFSPIWTTTNLWLIGAGIVTAVPLLLFSSGAKTIPLSLVGILQFITPTIQLFLGIFVFDEPFSVDKFVAFFFIWTALILYLSSTFHEATKNRPNPLSS